MIPNTCLAALAMDSAGGELACGRVLGISLADILRLQATWPVRATPPGPAWLGPGEVGDHGVPAGGPSHIDI